MSVLVKHRYLIRNTLREDLHAFPKASRALSRYVFNGAITFSNRSCRGKWRAHFLSNTPFLKIWTFSLLHQMVANGPELLQYEHICKHFPPSTHTNLRMKTHILWYFSPRRLVNSYRRFGDQKCVYIRCYPNQLQGEAFNVWLKQFKRSWAALTLKFVIHCLSRRL
jgi:hypothetical protein